MAQPNTRERLETAERLGSAERLQREAEFQNRRTNQSEPRDKFYFLTDRAERRYEEALGEVAGKRVLVVGCADSGVIPLAQRGARVVGIDIADEAIQQLSSAIREAGLEGSAECFVMDAEHLGFESGSFDVVCCTGVLHHVDVDVAASEWGRVLKPSGRLVMLEPMKYNPVVAAYRVMTPESRSADEHPLTPADIRRLRRHFEKVEVSGFALTSVVLAPLALLPRLRRLRDATLRLLEPADDLLLRLAPGLSYFSWTSLITCSRPR